MVFGQSSQSQPISTELGGREGERERGGESRIVCRKDDHSTQRKGYRGATYFWLCFDKHVLKISENSTKTKVEKQLFDITLIKQVYVIKKV